MTLSGDHVVNIDSIHRAVIEKPEDIPETDFSQVMDRKSHKKLYRI